MAILKAIKTKLEAYTPLGDVSGVARGESDDKTILQQLLQLEVCNTSILRKCYAITIRLEERKALNELRNEILSLLASLEDEGDYDDEDDGNHEDDRPIKKVKTTAE